MPLPSGSNTGEEHGEQSGNRGNYQTEISGQTLYRNRVSSLWISC